MPCCSCHTDKSKDGVWCLGVLRRFRREFGEKTAHGSLQLLGYTAGVCVIGATSRPDLLDAALLRPGRLDRLLYCGFPTASDRTAILKAGARRLELAPGVDFDGIAAATEGFTGAALAPWLTPEMAC